MHKSESKMLTTGINYKDMSAITEALANKADSDLMNFSEDAYGKTLLPKQTSSTNKFIISNGTKASWCDSVTFNGTQFAVSGSITANEVYNAVWTDYAEFFERGEETEAGDIIALDENSSEERYVKATKWSKLVVGVHSDQFAHLIGGEKALEGTDFVEYNLPKFIPVGLSGRVNVKFIGKSELGAPVSASEIPGVAVLSDENPIGYIVYDPEPESEELRRVRILIKK